MTLQLRILFGLRDSGTMVEWEKAVDDFPKLVKHQGANWEWSILRKSDAFGTDYDLIFTEVKNYDPRYKIDAVSIYEIKNGKYDDGCECGAKYTSFPQIHMLFCRKWSKI